MGIDPVWIVLTPSADDDAWKAAIRLAAETAGLVLRDADDQTPASSDDPEREVWLTSDCHVVESLGRRPTAVLIPRPETSPEAIGERLGIFPPQSVTHASLLLARAVAQDARRTRIITARDIAAARGQPIVLTEGLSVVPPAPRPVDPVRPAVQVALEFFAAGAPVPGLQVVWSERIFRYDQRAARLAQHIGDLGGFFLRHLFGFPFLPRSLGGEVFGVRACGQVTTEAHRNRPGCNLGESRRDDNGG